MLFKNRLIPKISMGCKLIFEPLVRKSSYTDRIAGVFDIQPHQILREHKAA